MDADSIADSTAADSTAAAPATLRRAELHGSLQHPVVDSMTFLNEVAQLYPSAISFAAGRPVEDFFDVENVHRQLDRFHAHLLDRFDGDVVQVRRTMLQYGRTKGIIHDLIARNLAVDEGIEVDPDAVVVTVGCQEALFLTLRALRRDPDDVLVAVRPGYVGALGAARMADMRVLPVGETAAGIDLAELATVLAGARSAGLRVRACYLVADFANPSGASLRRADRERLLRIAGEHDFLILEDNPYGLFGGDRTPQPTLKALDRHRRVVYLGSFAKTGLPGARVGYAVADQFVTASDGTVGLLADELAKIKSMITVNTSPVAQAVIGGRLLEHGCSLRAANVREQVRYQANRRRVLAGLAARFPAGSAPEVSWNTPDGGFFLVLTVPFRCDDDLLELSAHKYDVLWTPMHHFYGDGVPRRQLRLSFSHLSAAEIDAGLDNLAAFIRDQRI
jgi:(S)-3,5-dihydroxyphenylglycine transaminase